MDMIKRNLKVQMLAEGCPISKCVMCLDDECCSEFVCPSGCRYDICFFCSFQAKHLCLYCDRAMLNTPVQCAHCRQVNPGIANYFCVSCTVASCAACQEYNIENQRGDQLFCCEYCFRTSFDMCNPCGNFKANLFLERKHACKLIE